MKKICMNYNNLFISNKILEKKIKYFLIFRELMSYIWSQVLHDWVTEPSIHSNHLVGVRSHFIEALLLAADSTDAGFQ